MNPHRGCQIRLIVVETASWLSNPRRCRLSNPPHRRRNRIMVVESTSLSLSNPHHGCRSASSSLKPHHGCRSASSSSKPHHSCRICLIVVETASWLSNPRRRRCRIRIMVVDPRPRHRNRIIVVESASSSSNPPHRRRIRVLVIETAS